MKNIRYLIKRVAAYSIDLLIVLTISSLISSIPILNKNMDSYQKKYDEYTDKYNEFAEYLRTLQTSFEDNEISEEEYNELIKNEKYQELITNKYEDKKISKGEYNQIIKDINTDFDNTAKDYVYILNKKGVSNSIITLICTILYFGIFQYFLKGQTIGKKMLKLQVVSASNKKINVLNYLLRSLIVNDVFLNGVGIIFLLTTSKNLYTKANNIIGILISISEAIIIFLVLTRDDKMGLHDLLFNTKVIELNEPTSEEIKEPIKLDEELKKNIKIEANNKKNEKSKNISKNNKIIDAQYNKEVTNNGKERKGNEKPKPKNKSSKTKKQEQ